MREDIELSNFTAGELSPRMKGRIDVAKYFNGVDTMLNMVVMPQGGATARPGTLYAAAVGNQSYKPLLLPFSFNEGQNYVIEFGHYYARFYMDDAQIVSGGSPVQITTPYAASDLAKIGYTQSADTMFLTHPSYPVQLLTRSSNTAWEINPATFRDGPYLDVNITSTTMTLSGTVGTIVCVASSTVGINATPTNAGQGFLTTDVGRMMRIKVDSVWAWFLIYSYGSATQVSLTPQPAVNDGAAGAPDGTTPTVNWQLGKWGATTGYPYVPMFWQSRLVLCGTNNQPNAIEASVSSDFTNFAPSGSDGTVADNNALSWIISDDQVNAICWVSQVGSAQAAQLGLGTAAGENILQAATTSEALTPTNVQAYRETSYGSEAGVRPLRIGKSLLFVNRPGRKVHEWTFNWQVNGYIGPDITVLAEDVTAAGAGALGIVQMVYQQNPHSVVWAIRSDGQLIGCSYLKEQDIIGWHRHQLGGQFYGGPPIVESIACIPAQGGAYDELWLAVLRTVDGVPFRSVEVMQAYFEQSTPDMAFFVDCGLSTALVNPAATVTLSGLTNTAVTGAPPSYTGQAGIATASAAIFSTASIGKILRIANGRAVVTEYLSPETVVIQVTLPFPNLAPAAQGAWSLTAPFTTISGLSYLTGETVAVLGDGQSYGQQPVVNGQVEIVPGASYVTAGLPYTPVMVTMPFEPQRVAVATQGRLKRIDHLYVRFHETVGGAYGLRSIDDWSEQPSDTLEALDVRTPADPMGLALGLYSGFQRVALPGGSDKEARIIVMQNDPLPMTVLFISGKADAREGEQ